jgi:hypothetical protein
MVRRNAQLVSCTSGPPRLARRGGRELLAHTTTTLTLTVPVHRRIRVQPVTRCTPPSPTSPPQSRTSHPRTSGTSPPQASPAAASPLTLPASLPEMPPAIPNFPALAALPPPRPLSGFTCCSRQLTHPPLRAPPDVNLAPACTRQPSTPAGRPPQSWTCPRLAPARSLVSKPKLTQPLALTFETTPR